MAVYWVDPYIEASTGGIHGTTDTTSRSGTYAAPWAMSDMYSSSASGNTNLSGLSDGDEIRFKGLSISSYLIDAGSDWWVEADYTKKATSLNSATTTAISSWGNLGLVVMYGKTATDNYTVADSDGNKPYVFGMARINSTSSPTDQFQFSQGPHRIHHSGPLRAEGTSSATASLQMYLVDPQYYIPLSHTSAQYFACYSNIGIKVTDGWTSSTVRDGYTILPIFKSSPTSSTTELFNQQTNSTTGPDTLYDMPKTHFIFHRNDGNGYTYSNLYLQPATGGYHSGLNYTQRIGGFHVNGSSSAAFFDYTGYYYYTGASDTSTDSVNNSEVGIVNTHYYGYRGFTRYGPTTESEYATHRINNVFTHYYLYTLSTVNRAANFVLGTHMCYYDFNRYTLYTPNSSATTPVELLNGSYFYKYNFYGGGLFGSGSLGLDITVPSTVYNPDGPALASRISSAGEGPRFLYEVNNKVASASNPKMNPSSWTDGIAASYMQMTTNPVAFANASVSIGVLDVGSDDYTTGSCKFLIGSNLNIIRPEESGGLAQQTRLTFHTNGNTSDGLPIGMMMSDAKTELYHVPMLYFNDPDKSDALCIVSNDQGDTSTYVQDIDVPITLTSAYTSSDTIRLKARIETTSNWSTSYYRFGAFYMDTNNEPAWAEIRLSNTAVTTATDYTYDLAASSLYNPGSNYRFLRFSVVVANNPNQVQKLWIHELSATVV